MEKKSTIIIKDIPLSRLVPTNPKPFKKEDLARVRRSLEGIEMLEPFVVCENGETFLISDGNKRYYIFRDAGIESAPCVLQPRLDTYTTSRQVIDVSPTEREKMINKVCEKVTEEKVAAAIGRISLKPSIDENLAKKLHTAIQIAYEQKKLTKTALHELKNVTPKRQAEILRELKQVKDFSLDMVKGKVLLTPITERIIQKKKTPWQKRDENRELITKRLEEITKQNALLELTFHTYVSDVIKQLTYFRGLLDDEPIKQYIMQNYPDMYKKIREIMDRE
jgi:ParB-like chromosome segregation protein Spo0J